jgi:UDP-N-acetylmuramoyl-tripeptide--D-alanyl-D-alanine ligase
MELMTLKSLTRAVNGTMLQGDANTEISNVIIDSRQNGSQAVFFAIKGDNTDGHFYINQVIKNNAAAIVIHNDIEIDGIDIAVIKVKNTTDALLDLAGYYRKLFSIPLIAVTGSCGKTTTKDIIASVLSEKYSVLKTQGNLNNQTGMPLSIFNLNKNHEMAVIEIGMSNAGEIYNMVMRINPDVAVITNIGYSHIEYLKTRENILKAKLEITSFFNHENVAIINGDDDYLKGVDSNLFKIYKIGIQNGDIKAEDIIEKNNKINFKVNNENYTFPLIGKHNIYNCLYAIILARLFGLSREEIQRGFDHFIPSKNRMDITEHDGITIINDVYNSNPHAAKAALDVLHKMQCSGRKIAVLADMLELGEYSQILHEELGECARIYGIDILVTIGNQAKHISKKAAESGMKNTVHFYNNICAADYLKSILKDGDLILFKGSRGMKLESIIDILTLQEN